VPQITAPLLLAVDVGNSHTSCGLFTQERLQGHFRLRSEPRQTADELAAACQSQLALRGHTLAALDGFVLASVVPVLEHQWRACAAAHCSALRDAPLVVQHQLDCGLTLAIEQPETLGMDRLVNAAMAWQRCHTACIAVDVGTALTCDCVNAAGVFVGGVILPGPALALEALANGTARLPRVDLAAPVVSAMGKNTHESIRAGMLIGWGGMVDRLIERLSPELAPDGAAVRVLATGGMAVLLAPHSKRLDDIDPWLTLSGLAWLHQRHCRP